MRAAPRRDSPLQPGPGTTRAVDEARSRPGDDDQRRLDRERDEHPRREREERRVPNLAHAVALRRHVVDTGLPKKPGQLLVTARLDGPTHPGRARAECGAEQSRQRSGGRSRGRRRRQWLRYVTEGRAGGGDVGAHARRELRGRRTAQRGNAGGTGTDGSRGEKHRNTHRTPAGPNTRASSSSRPRRPRKSIPTPVRHAAMTSVTNPPLDR